MPTIIEKQLKFEFPNNWEATKFDEWSFYRRQFQKLGSARLNCSQCEASIRCAECKNRNVAGTKGVDFFAIEPGSICWHVEVKDYRKTRKSNFVFLADEVALKVRDTLACLVVAQINANDDGEKQIAKDAVRSSRHRIVLHLEQPTTGRSFHSTKTRLANVLQRLMQLVKSIDPHPLVVDMTMLDKVGWTVT
ncbi:MAG: hypothetical protein K8R46_01070 [Pirellulales bacterium]|nr:hypothetical protein [Pirellulales bacterium]